MYDKTNTSYMYDTYFFSRILTVNQKPNRKESSIDYWANSIEKNQQYRKERKENNQQYRKEPTVSIELEAAQK